MRTTAETLCAALHDQRTGNYARAEALYRRVIETDPAQPEAWFWLGAVCQALNRSEEAVHCYRQALCTRPDLAEAHNNLGVALDDQGKQEEAVASYRRAVELKPDYADALNNLGTALVGRGQLEEAAAYCREALRIQPDFAKAHNNLGLALAAQGKSDEALASYQQAVRFQPDFAEAYNNQGVILAAQGKPAAAVGLYQRALSLQPLYAEAHNNLGVARSQQQHFNDAAGHLEQALRLKPDYTQAWTNLADALVGQGKLDEALAHYGRSLQLQPDQPDVLNNLGNVLWRQGRHDHAVDCFERAVQLRADFADALNNLGSARMAQGQIEVALDYLRQAIQSKPADAALHSNFLLALHYDPRSEQDVIFREHLRWARQHAEPLAAAIRPHTSDRSTSRRLRVGYVSGDFRQHVMGFFTEPVLAAHNHEQFEIVCYADVPWPDALTQRLQNLANCWHSVVGLSDEEVADIIRRDAIDILVDLAGHTAGNRLLVFARKPAPVQVTLFGYPETTGLATMDYRLTDAISDPPGATDRFHTEKLVRLPEIGWCYQPPACPDVSPLPARQTGYVTFGSMNNLAKVTADVVMVWSRILRAVPDSRLLILTGAGGTADARLRDAFARNGVAPERLRLVGRTGREAYFAFYREVDLCLDSFPYSGCNTSCDALWMGAPVITLAGKTCTSRHGVALLSQLGLADLIAVTPEAYADLAAQLATDWDKLSQLREGLHKRMKASALLNTRRFTRNLEEAYRAMWGDTGV